MTRHILLSFIILVAFSFRANAQTFMEHITGTGSGTVTVQQDSRLDDIVNGTKHYVAPKKEKEEKVPGLQTGKKIKASGYRIQVYFGGSSRTDQANAQRAGAKVNTIFPELQAYTSFESPNWRCRVGDFANRAEASDYLNKLKKAKVIDNANIVRSEVFVYK